MKIISFCSLVKGAGNTTALMLVASKLSQQDHKVALVEADKIRPLAQWKNNAQMSGTWDPSCTVAFANTVAKLETAYGTALAKGVDYLLIDAVGEESRLNNTIILSSHFIVMPTKLDPLSVDGILVAYKYAINLLIHHQREVPSAILRNQVPISELTSKQKIAVGELESLPLFPDAIHRRDAFSEMKTKGMLHKTVEQASKRDANRLQLRGYQSALHEASSLTAGILDVLDIV